VGLGWNRYGELGDEADPDRTTPAPVRLFAPESGVTATAIATGFYHSLALTSTGQVYAWGLNGSGQLGAGTTTTCYPPEMLKKNPCSRTPVAVGLPSGVTATTIAAGLDHSLALDP
jgi:alpha-tubulin suppressor-like RCC1 family protein